MYNAIMPRKNHNPNAAPDRALNPCFTPEGLPVPSAQLFDIVRELQKGDNRVLLSFSGKDSLAAWLYLHENGFEVIPYWCYMVPGLSFDVEMIEYYQDFFKTKIYRFLHPAAYHLLYGLCFQPPDLVSTILKMDLQKIDYAFLESRVIEYEGLRPDTFTAVGIRAADNMMRHRLVHQMGPLGLKHRRYWWAAWDFKIDDVMEIIRRHGAKLPKSYAIWGATGDILHYRYLKILRDQAPADYEKVLQMYPLIDIEIFRYEGVQ